MPLSGAFRTVRWRSSILSGIVRFCLSFLPRVSNCGCCSLRSFQDRNSCVWAEKVVNCVASSSSCWVSTTSGRKASFLSSLGGPAQVDLVVYRGHPLVLALRASSVAIHLNKIFFCPLLTSVLDSTFSCLSVGPFLSSPPSWTGKERRGRV